MSDVYERMSAAFDELALAEDESAGVVTDWLDAQPDDASFVVNLAHRMDRVALHAAGPPDEFVPIVGEFLAGAGASEEELSLIGSAGEAMEADLIGSWVELGTDLIDGGWYLPVNSSLTKATNYAPATPVRQQLLEWARRCGADTCAQLKRSLSDDEPATELTVVIPGDDPEHELALAQQGMKMIGAPWFPERVHTGLTLSRSMELLLVVSLNEQGLARAGVLIQDPGQDICDLIGSATEGAEYGALKRFEKALGVERAGMLGCFQYPWGFSVEHYYAL